MAATMIKLFLTATILFFSVSMALGAATMGAPG